MNISNKSKGLVLIGAYIILMLVAAYKLFTLQQDMIYTTHALSIEGLEAVKPVLNLLYALVIGTFVLGLIAMVFLHRAKNMDVIYVEKNEDKKGKTDTEDKLEEKDKITIDSIKSEITGANLEEKDLLARLLTAVCDKLEAGVGAVYKIGKAGDKNVLKMKASYALGLGESQTLQYELGEGLVGQVGLEEKPMIIADLPEGYVNIVSGLGRAKPAHLMIVPIHLSNKLYGVAEIASFTAFDKTHEQFVEEAFAYGLKKKDTGSESKPAKIEETQRSEKAKQPAKTVKKASKATDKNKKA